HRLHKAVVDAFGGDHLRRRGATLPGGEEAALHGAVRGDLDIGVVEHDERILAAHLELEFLHAGDRRLRHLAADRLRAGEADADARAYRLHHFAGNAQRLAGEELEDVGGAHHLAGRLRQRLAFLAREQIAELGLAAQYLRADRIERIEAALWRAGRPGGNRGLRGADRLGRLRLAGAGVAPDHIARIRR